MKTKKEVLLDILNDLKPHWSDAESIIANIQNGGVNDELMDKLYSVIMEEVKNIGDAKLNAKLNQSMLMMQKIKEKEEEDRKNEKSEIDELESMMDNI